LKPNAIASRGPGTTRRTPHHARTLIGRSATRRRPLDPPAPSPRDASHPHLALCYPRPVLLLTSCASLL
jgi:hypothetical protein